MLEEAESEYEYESEDMKNYTPPKPLLCRAPQRFIQTHKPLQYKPLSSGNLV